MLRRFGHLAATALLGGLIVGCGADDETSSGAGGSPPAACAVGESTAPDGSCCPAGSLPLTEGGCRAAGVPEEACPAGFEWADQGCDPLLPAEPCLTGEMALPGDPSCQAVASCGSGPWGDIDIEPGAQHVDGSYGGGASDGSADHPWTSIGEALAAVDPHGMVAIAAGSYLEDLRIQTKPVRLLGRCPAMVELIATGGQSCAVLVLGGADGTELDGLGITGPGCGVGATGSLELALRRLWIHDTQGRGITIQDDLGPTSATIERVLIERATEMGAFAWGAQVRFADIVVRDTAALPDGSAGLGLGVSDNPGTGRRAVSAIDRAVLVRNREHGIFVEGADLSVYAAVVRATEARLADGEWGYGVAVENSPERQRSNVTLSGSVVDQSTGAGMFLKGSELSIDASVVRDTRPHATLTTMGRGISVEADDATGERPRVTVRRSLIAGGHEVGIFAEAADVLIESTVIRDVQPLVSDLDVGRGLAFQSHTQSAARTHVDLRGCVVERVHDVGVFGGGADISMGSTRIDDVYACAQNLRSGKAIHLQPELNLLTTGHLTMQDSLAQGCREAAIMVGASSATIHNSVVRDVHGREADGLFGDGIVSITAIGLRSHVILTDSLIEGATRAGATAFGASLEIGGTTFECNTFDLAAEPFQGDPSVSDLGANRCGCNGVETPCQARSANLEPPVPLEDE